MRLSISISRSFQRAALASRPRVALSKASNRNLTTGPSPSSEELENWRRKLMWRCKERGMVENELLLKPFAAEEMPKMDATALTEFQIFLDEPDPKIFKWLSGREPFPDQYLNSPHNLANRLLAHVGKYRKLEAKLPHD